MKIAHGEPALLLLLAEGKGAQAEQMKRQQSPAVPAHMGTIKGISKLFRVGYK